MLSEIKLKKTSKKIKRLEMNNKSYIGISFIVLIFGIWAVPKIVAKFQKSDLVEIGPVPTFELTNQNEKKI